MLHRRISKKIFLFLLFYTGILFSQDTTNLPSYLYKRLEGKINDKLSIVMNLTCRDSSIDGNYYYTKNGEPIGFQYSSRMINNDSIHIEEEGGFDDNYNTITTGIFDGRFTAPNEIRGRWRNNDSTRIYNFQLRESYPEGSAKFEIKHLDGQYGTGDYSPYAVSVDLSYPIMNDYPDKVVENKINSFIIKNYLAGSIYSDTSYDNLENRIDSFIEDYIEEIEADSELVNDYKPSYEDDEFTDISFNSDYILSLEIIEYIFTGGAHGNSIFSLSSFNLKTGEQIKLEDIFYGDFKKRLNEEGEKIFRNEYSADSSQSLYDQGYFGFENGFALNENFDLYNGGIKFQFNQYEAGAYVLGAPEVFIPWSKITDIIRPDGIVSEMIK